MKEQQTIKKIQELVPEILELKKGCKVKAEDNTLELSSHKLYTILGEAKELSYLRDAPYYILDGCSCMHNSLVRANEMLFKEILGRDITLEDCLIAIEPYIGKTFKYQSYWLNLVSLWQLNKPFQDQSQECKDFIGDLILT